MQATLPRQWVGWLQGVRHVCFDKDGTLIDVHRYWRHTVRLRADRVQQDFRLSERQRDGLIEAMGVDLHTGRIRFGGPVGYAPRPAVIKAAQQFLASQRVRTTETALAALFASIDGDQQQRGDYDVQALPGAAEFLGALSEQGFALSICSSDRKEHIRAVLDALSLSSYVPHVVGGGCLTHAKPHPEGFLLACERAGVPPSETVYVGDTVADMRMGMAGGANKVIGVASGLSSLEELSACTPFVCAQLMKP